MTVRVVCFDLGGVVIRICRSFEEAALQAGVRIRHASDEVAVFREVRRLVESHQVGRMSAPEFHRAMSDAFDRRYAAEEIARVHAAITRDEYDGICATIHEIRRRGLTTACLSNTNDAHWQILLSSPALQALDHRFASHLWGLAKPDASIYRRFEAELDVRGGEILFFDDLVDNVDAARALGWDAVLVDHAGDTARQVRDALAARGQAV